MNKLDRKRQIQILNALTEGVSLRATSRMVDVSINTVTKLLVDVGRVCAEYQDKALRNLSCKRIQCDEIWSFVYSKAKNVPKKFRRKYGVGDVWTWTALDADTKLVLSWLVGNRDARTGRIFMKDVASRLNNRVQLTTDGHKIYLEAVERAFGSDIDFSQIVKIYGADPKPENTRYSPAKCLGAIPDNIQGSPDPAYVSTSYAERQNLTMRMNMRRFTRLTNGFSKKVENHAHAIALYFMHYNFIRIHKTLRVTPAMEGKVVDRLWKMGDILDLLEKK